MFNPIKSQRKEAVSFIRFFTEPLVAPGFSRERISARQDADAPKLTDSPFVKQRPT
jgi:hypothetical protein